RSSAPERSRRKAALETNPDSLTTLMPRRVVPSPRDSSRGLPDSRGCDRRQERPTATAGRARVRRKYKNLYRSEPAAIRPFEDPVRDREFPPRADSVHPNFGGNRDLAPLPSP